MGIDVYLRWDNQTEEEKQKQYTGFSTNSGHTGYLREAYHGNPYATRVLMPEGFSADGDGVAIPNATLRERLPRTLLCALVRNLVLYGNERKPYVVKLDDGEGTSISQLAPLLIGRLKASKHQPADFENDYPPEILNIARAQLVLGAEHGWLPRFARAYVDFVDLHGKLEADGKHPMIEVSG